MSPHRPGQLQQQQNDTNPGYASESSIDTDLTNGVAFTHRQTLHSHTLKLEVDDAERDVLKELISTYKDLGKNQDGTFVFQEEIKVHSLQLVNLLKSRLLAASDGKSSYSGSSGTPL